MLVLLFVILMAASPQQQAEQDIQRQQQQLQQMQDQLDRIVKAIEGQAPACAVDVIPASGLASRTVPPSPDVVVQLNLFSTISQPLDACLPAEVRVAATYLDANGDVVCSGVVENAAEQKSLTETIHFDIRPWNFREFVWWRNEPPQTNSGPKRLVCLTREGTAEITAEEFQRAASVRVHATVLPTGGGVSTVEMELRRR